MDLAVSNWYSSQASVLLGNPDGTFQAATSYTVAGAWQVNSPVLADFNRDGKLDLAVTNFQSGTLAVLLN